MAYLSHLKSPLFVVQFTEKLEYQQTTASFCLWTVPNNFTKTSY